LKVRPNFCATGSKRPASALRTSAKTGIIAADERLSHETAKLNDISTQITMAQGQTADSSSKRKSAGNLETLAEVMQNQLIIALNWMLPALKPSSRKAVLTSAKIIHKRNAPNLSSSHSRQSWMTKPGGSTAASAPLTTLANKRKRVA